MNVELNDEQLEALIEKAFNDGFQQGYKCGIQYVKNVVKELDGGENG